MDRHAAAVAGAVALGAAAAAPHKGDVGAEIGALLLGDGHLPGAVGADPAHQALGDQTGYRVGDHVPLHAHVLKTDDGGERVIRVQGRKDHVARDGRADRDGRRLGIAGLADHDDIGVLTQQGAQAALKGQARNVVDLRLVDAGQIALDRVLDRRDIDLPLGDGLQDHVERCRLAGTCRPGQVDDAVGAVEQRQKPPVGLIVHAEVVGVFNVGVAGQDTQHGLLAKDGRQDRDADVDVGAGLKPGAEMPVLRDAVLGNVKVGHDLDAGDERLMQGALQRHIVDDDAVNAHTDLCLALKRLNVDIRGGGRHGTLHKAVQQADDRRVQIAALGGHVDGEILGLRGGHIAAVGIAGCLAGADLGVIVADGAAQRLQLGQHDLRLHGGQLADVLDGVVVQRVVGGDGQRMSALRDGQHVIFLRQLLRNFLDSRHINGSVLNVDHADLQALGKGLQDLPLIDIAQLLQCLADTQVAVLLLVGKGGVELLGRDVAELDQNIAKTDVFHGCTPPLSQSTTRSVTL